MMFFNLLSSFIFLALNVLFFCSMHQTEDRTISYLIATDYGNVYEGRGVGSFIFTGSSTSELTRRLQEETGLNDIYVCAWSRLNHHYIPLGKQLLPKYEFTHHMTVFNASSRGEFSSFHGCELCLLLFGTGLLLGCSCVRFVRREGYPPAQRPGRKVRRDEQVPEPGQSRWPGGPWPMDGGGHHQQQKPAPSPVSELLRQAPCCSPRVVHLGWAPRRRSSASAQRPL